MALAVVVLTSPSHKCCLSPSVLGSWRKLASGATKGVLVSVGLPGSSGLNAKAVPAALEEAFETRQRLLEEIMRMEPRTPGLVSASGGGAVRR